MAARTGLVHMVVLAATGLPLMLAAQDAPVQRERASLHFGAFGTDRATTTRLDDDAGQGTEIDLESDLGLEASSTVMRLGAHVWIRPRQRFDFALFNLDRTATTEISETIRFGGQTFALGAVLTTEMQTRIAKASYTFAPLSRRRGYFGLSAGVYASATEIVLSDPDFGALTEGDLTAPLPVLGFRGEYALTRKITVRGASEWFQVDIDDVGGRLRDTYIGADYALGDHFALGLAYNDVSMQIEADEPGGYRGSLDWGYDGWLLFVKYDIGASRGAQAGRPIQLPDPATAAARLRRPH